MAARSKIDKVMLTIFKSRPYATTLYFPLSDRFHEYDYNDLEISRLHDRAVIMAKRHDDDIVWYVAPLYNTFEKNIPTITMGVIPYKLQDENLKRVILNSVKNEDYYLDYAYAIKPFDTKRHILNTDFVNMVRSTDIAYYRILNKATSSYANFKQMVGNSTTGENVVDNLSKSYFIFESDKDVPLSVKEYDKMDDLPHVRLRNFMTNIRAYNDKLKKEEKMLGPQSDEKPKEYKNLKLL